MTKEQIILEAYKDLSAWNQQDAQTVGAFDKIFLPVVIGGFVAALATNNHHYAFFGKLLLWALWLLLSDRYKKRIEKRFCIMKNIERNLDFEAYSLISEEDMTISPNMKARWIFCIVTVFFSFLGMAHKSEWLSLLWQLLEGAAA